MYILSEVFVMREIYKKIFFKLCLSKIFSAAYLQRLAAKRMAGILPHREAAPVVKLDLKNQYSINHKSAFGTQPVPIFHWENPVF
jgi:hypothetical protein